MAEAAGPRQSSIRSTTPEARDWLRLYVTEEERQHEGLFFFFPFILILLQSLSKNNPISLPQECSASEPWLPRPLCISLAAAEQSHYRCHSVTLVKSTPGEGSAVALLWVRRGRDRWEPPGFLGRAFPGVWAEHPLPPRFGAAGTRECCSSWGVPVALLLGEVTVTVLPPHSLSRQGRAQAPLGRTLPCPHLMLEENLAGALFFPHRGSSAPREQGGLFPPTPGFSQAVPACSMWDAAPCTPGAGEAAPSCPL